MNPVRATKTMASDTSVHSSLFFLKRDPRYDSEKVYDVRRKYASKMPRTNVQLDLVKDIEIQDMRDKECSLTTNGFFLLNFGSKMQAEDFQERSTLQGIFFPQLAHAIKQSLNASRIQIFDYTVRPQIHSIPKLKFYSYANGIPIFL